MRCRRKRSAPAWRSTAAATTATLLVEGDAAQLRDVFLNLAQNAIQAMPKGGRLTINCAAMPNRRVRVRVEDTGVGIAPENLAKIFDLYYTTKERGTGIGLVAGVSNGPDSQRRRSTSSPRSGSAPRSSSYYRPARPHRVP